MVRRLIQGERDGERQCTYRASERPRLRNRHTATETDREKTEMTEPDRPDRERWKEGERDSERDSGT